MAKCAASTSASLGLRLCGMKVCIKLLIILFCDPFNLLNNPTLFQVLCICS
jgi:hypothetical protein